jgi:hypothetical protein
LVEKLGVSCGTGDVRGGPGVPLGKEVHELHFYRPRSGPLVERVDVKGVGEQDEFVRYAFHLPSSTEAHNLEIVSAIVGSPLEGGSTPRRKSNHESVRDALQKHGRTVQFLPIHKVSGIHRDSIDCRLVEPTREPAWRKLIVGATRAAPTPPRRMVGFESWSTGVTTRLNRHEPYPPIASEPGTETNMGSGRWKVACEDGFEVISKDSKELVALVQWHGQHTHNKNFSEAEVLGMAKEL